MFPIRHDNCTTAHDHLASPSAQVVRDGDGWLAFVPGLPVTADGATFEEAIDELGEAIREYADDWRARLRRAQNHSDSWRLVQLVDLCDDDQLRTWLSGPATDPERSTH